MKKKRNIIIATCVGIVAVIAGIFVTIQLNKGPFDIGGATADEQKSYERITKLEARIIHKAYDGGDGTKYVDRLFDEAGEVVEIMAADGPAGRLYYESIEDNSQGSAYESDAKEKVKKLDKTIRLFNKSIAIPNKDREKLADALNKRYEELKDGKQ